jgi:hypothetical protein
MLIGIYLVVYVVVGFHCSLTNTIVLEPVLYMRYSHNSVHVSYVLKGPLVVRAVRLCFRNHLVTKNF